jgi:hypothetical protein
MLRGVLPILLAVLVAGCGIAEKIQDLTTQTVNVLDDAIAALETQSAAWQSILQEAQARLTADAQSTIRNELASLVSRSLAQAGVEFRCNADFVGARVRQHLIRVKARLLGRAVPPVEPALCQVVPVAVDRSLVPGRLTHVEFYGYDFTAAANLAVFLERAGGSRVNVTSQLDRPTHYAMTLKFGATGVQLDAASSRFVLEWDNRQISTIAVIQPATPVCQSRLITLPTARVTFTPPHTRGNADFSGNGPRVAASVTLVVTPQELRARVYMRARETKHDWTTAEGTREFPLFVPDPGWRIERVVGNQASTHSYTDSDHAIDSFDLGSGGPVRRLEVTGDTRGSEAGTRTQVEVTFNPLRVELVQTADCVTARAVRALQDRGLLSGPARLRLMRFLRDQPAPTPGP